MNVLVAGATGAIGRQLISALVSARHNVFGMTSSKLGLQTLKEYGAEGLLASALDAQAVDAAIKRARPEVVIDGLDVVLDTVGGDAQQRSLRLLKPGGIVVSVVSPVPETTQKRFGVRAAYFYVDVTTARLNKITELFDSGKLVSNGGSTVPTGRADLVARCADCGNVLLRLGKHDRVLLDLRGMTCLSVNANDS